MQHLGGAISRARLIQGALATAALAGCSGKINLAAPAPTAAPESCTLLGAPPSGVSQLSDILSHEVFANLDMQALLDAFDASPQIDANHQAYLATAGQQVQQGYVIQSIPSGGIVIQSPGTYTLGGNVTWTPSATATAAITIASSNVTLNLGNYTLTASVSDNSLRTTGILVNGTVSDVAILNGTISSPTEYGILATYVCGLTISGVTVTGLGLQNLAVRLLTPTGIYVGHSQNVSISSCTVTNLNVTTDSSAGFQLMYVNQGSVYRCTASSLTNNDGAVQGFSCIWCTNVITSQCTSDTLQSHFATNLLTSGHTVLGFCPIFCQQLEYVGCTATNLTGCCDDCHGMSVFLDANVAVNGFQASAVTDGVSPDNSGAKATGLEVYGLNVTVTNSNVSGIKAINPQDRQSTGFSAWGALISFTNCTATNVSVVKDIVTDARAIGFGWAPDPRPELRVIGAFDVTYTSCSADTCDVAFDTWFHVDSTWTQPAATNCGTFILVEPNGTRVLSCNGCSECVPGITITLTNIASGNTYPQ